MQKDFNGFLGIRPDPLQSPFDRGHGHISGKKHSHEIIRVLDLQAVDFSKASSRQRFQQEMFDDI